MKTTRHATAVLGLAGLIPLILSSCKNDPPAGAPSASASTSAAASALAAPATTTSAAPAGGDDDVRPVYPQTNEPPDPVAVRYCDLVHERPEKRRLECCPKTAFHPFRPTSECARTLSFALRSKAIRIDPAALDACERAYDEQLKHCDGLSRMPPACAGILQGTVGVDQLCRSSLECAGETFCRGVGPTEAGKCSKPLPEGAACGGSADALGAFTNQNAYATHPECDGHCSKRKCAKVVAAAGKCESSIECARGLRCSASRCTDAPLPAAGEPCPDKACAEGLSCLRGQCSAPRRVGDDCGSDDECLSLFCDDGDGGTGKCAVMCQLGRPDIGRRPPPPKK